MILEIKDLHVSIGDKEIIKGVNILIRENEFHVIMGPNGSGKTTLAKAIMGHPEVRITRGQILADSQPINDMTPDKRAKLGLFMLFQNPVEIDGVGFVNFLRSALESLKEEHVNTREMVTEIKEYSSKLKISNGIIGRSLNAGFSGGEKKKSEILQMAILKPKIAILDEPDSGLDIDAIKIAADNITEISEKNGMGLLVITHYNRILSYMKPEFAHIMVDGQLVTSGGIDMVDEIEREGYGKYIK